MPPRGVGPISYKKMKRVVYSIAIILTIAVCPALGAGEVETLQQWKAGETVSAAEVEMFGETRCFEALEIPEDVWVRMQGRTFKPNPHIGREDLRYLRLLHWDYDGRIHLGEMVCNAAVAHELVDIFRQLYQARYPVGRMVLPDVYGADDELQMRANNTSCFCYRPVSGTGKLSKHAYGLAVDLNTLYNPYVGTRGGRRFVQPSTAEAYTDRSKAFRYKIDRDDLAYRLFTSYGYTWGGSWRSVKDYQHFEKELSGATKPVCLGDERFDVYVPLIEGRRVALYSNHTAMIGGRHLADLMVERGVDVAAIFSPEHGFRGKADAGASVKDDVDGKTGIPILSLYGQGRKNRPSDEDMQRFDVLLVDIQDVGLRYYTYYVTMCHLMDACAAAGKEVIILDRPNPNGHYVDGPLLDMKLRSGVGHLPIPVVHGMTLGELAQMAIGEKWLNEGNECRLTVVPCLNYTHQTHYALPVAPSPNLPNMQAVYLYPSLCPFEGTVVSLGRGTDKPFQLYGHPFMKWRYAFTFTPRSVPGATRPPLLDQQCFGVDLSALPYEKIWEGQMNLSYVIDAYRCLKAQGKAEGFFTPFFDKLLGQTYVREMIMEGRSEAEIRARWKQDVEQFKARRKKYLLYP